MPDIRKAAIALAVLVLTAASCANEPPGSGDGGGGIEHPTGDDEVVLRLSYEGGFVPIQNHLTQLPSFTLYGDGMILGQGPQIELYPEPALPAVSRRSVSEEGIRMIVQAAIDAGLGDGDQDHSDFGTTMIADASTAVFTLSAEGRTSKVSVYALLDLPERPNGMSEEEFTARTRLSDLAERLGALGQWLPEGSLGPEEPFDAAGYRLFVGPYRPDEQLPQEPATWPLATPLPTDDVDGSGYACLAVNGEEWAELAPLAKQANSLTPWTSGGDRFSVLFRPLLPDESGC